MNDLRLVLKVCEGCGALWLRTQAAESVYCRRCAEHLAHFPAPRGRHAGGRKPRLARASRCTANGNGGQR
jgi:predicted amidophosphoribosyltransferase